MTTMMRVMMMMMMMMMMVLSHSHAAFVTLTTELARPVTRKEV
jgi:hypothetical protein